MLNILIVDDEAPARDRLQRMVDELLHYAVAGTARSGKMHLMQLRHYDRISCYWTFRCPAWMA